MFQSPWIRFAQKDRSVAQKISELVSIPVDKVRAGDLYLDEFVKK